MRVAVIGGGPGGLFFARLLALSRPDADINVYERSPQEVATGFGLVFSGRALAAVTGADPETAALINDAGVSWTDLELRLPGGSVRYGNYEFIALARHKLMELLRDQAVKAGARLSFRREISVADVPADVVVLADGARSRNRDAFSSSFGTTVSPGRSHYIWFSTGAQFDAVTFPFVNTEYGAIGAHAHPYANGVSSFLVETDEATLAAAGPVLADAESARNWLAETFAEQLSGLPLISNASHWSRFPVVHNEHWSHGNMVLLGDAAHTTHFSIGSGTAMAMKDAVALAKAIEGALPGRRTVPEAFAQYERARRSSVTRAQALAQRSMRWWETFGTRMHEPPAKFAAHFATRTGLVSFSNAGCRDVTGSEHHLGPVRLRNRIVTVTDSRTSEAALVLSAGRGDWTGSRTSAAAAGAVFGALADSPETVADACAAGARVLEIPAAALLSEAGRSTRPGTAVVASVPCPDTDAFSTAGDEFVVQCRRLGDAGAVAIRLRGGGRQTDVLAHADRIRSETGISTMVEVPDEPLDETIRIALATGRLDLVVITTANTHGKKVAADA
jgi:2-polyprenyl-6-methoxyphenol hydroxylase-like FAD-dependent oxidoreductase